MIRTLCAFAILSWGPVALGQSSDREDEEIHLDFQAPPRCSDATTFLAELRARSPRLRSGGGVRGDLVVTVTEASGHVSGRLVIRSSGKVVGTREVDGDTCKDVVAAIALAAALDLEEVTSTESPPPPSLDPLPEMPPPSAPARRADWSWQLVFAAHASLTTGVADTPLFGVPVFVGLESKPRGLVSPSVRALFEGTESGSVSEAVGALRFTWFIGGLEACPLRLGSSALALRPCARVEAGVIRASPEDVSFGREVSRPWVSAGIVARAEWVPTRLIFFEIEGGGRAALIREQWVFLPGPNLYTVPPVGLLVEAGLGVHFL